jgi:hypothetical protein
MRVRVYALSNDPWLLTQMKQQGLTHDLEHDLSPVAVCGLFRSGLTCVLKPTADADLLAMYVQRADRAVSC